MYMVILPQNCISRYDSFKGGIELPAPKISPKEVQFIQNTLNPLRTSAEIINTTVSPAVFFKKLHFTLDLLLLLQEYEKYGIFKTSTPTQDYNSIINRLEKIVDAFIDRAVDANQHKMWKLKTRSAQIKLRDDFATKLISAFDCAHTFWSGSWSPSRIYPHYTGPLFTQSNYNRVQAIFDSTCDD